MIRWFQDLCKLRTDRRVLDLESRLEEKDRLIEVLRTENKAMAEVIERDRARVASEMAAYNRTIAQCEANDERVSRRPIQFSA